MVELSRKNVLLAGITLIVSSLISGYFFSIGAELWQLTKGPLNIPVPNLGTPFWYVSVPIGMVALGVLGYAAYMSSRTPKPVAPTDDTVPHMFDAGLSPSEGLCTGDTVVFTVRFSGILLNGYLGTWIEFPDRGEGGALDHNTIPINPTRFTKGNLNGFVNRQFVWDWFIPNSAPPGKYTFYIRVHNYFPGSWFVRFRLRCLLWLKTHGGISSIDTKVLTVFYRIVREKKATVIIGRRRTEPLKPVTPASTARAGVILRGTEENIVEGVTVPTGATGVEDIGGRKNRIGNVTVRSESEEPEQGDSAKTEENGR